MTPDSAGATAAAPAAAAAERWVEVAAHAEDVTAAARAAENVQVA